MLSLNWLSHSRADPLNKDHVLLEVSQEMQEADFTTENVILSFSSALRNWTQVKIKYIFEAITTSKETTSHAKKETSYFLIVFDVNLPDLPPLPLFGEIGLSFRITHWQFHSSTPWENFRIIFGAYNGWFVFFPSNPSLHGPSVRKMTPLELPCNLHLAEAEKNEETFCEGLVWNASTNQRLQKDIKEEIPKFLSKSHVGVTLSCEMMKTKSKCLSQIIEKEVERHNSELQELAEMLESLQNKIHKLESKLSNEKSGFPDIELKDL